MDADGQSQRLRTQRPRSSAGFATSCTRSQFPPAEGWFPEERITIQQAIKAYTYNSAYASFEENIKGSIEVGKLADLTVLSENLLTLDPDRLKDVEVLLTMVGGKIVHEKEAL